MTIANTDTQLRQRLSDTDNKVIAPTGQWARARRIWERREAQK